MTMSQEILARFIADSCDGAPPYLVHNSSEEVLVLQLQREILKIREKRGTSNAQHMELKTHHLFRSGWYLVHAEKLACVRVVVQGCAHAVHREHPKLV